MTNDRLEQVTEGNKASDTEKTNVEVLNPSDNGCRFALDSLELGEGYSIISIDLAVAPKKVFNPETKQLEYERTLPCDFSMRIVKSNKYIDSTEIILRDNAELTPIAVINKQIKLAIIKDIDIIAII